MNWRALLVPSCLVAALWIGCSADPVRLGDNPEGGLFPPTPGLDASDGPGMCIGTECPEPYATCLTSGVPTYKCGTDLSSDDANCGTCGNVCGSYDPLHMKSRCVSGRCEVECVNTRDPVVTDWRDCNTLVDDGCEVNVRESEAHCGACGNACAPGQLCADGRCGCPAGLIACPVLFGVILCVDPKTDDNNCGGCGNVCADDAPGACAEPRPANTKYGCVGGYCDRIKCELRTFDCNHDLGTLGCKSDGCEVGGLNDRNNCGGCGIVCEADEECLFLNGDGPHCLVPCDKSGMTLCPDGRCVDVLNDVTACGVCGNFCPEPGPNQVAFCRKGNCGVECVQGFADCNVDQSDGCEVNLAIHPEHCGSCHNACNVELGQPCVEGKCLTAPCDQPGAR